MFWAPEPSAAPAKVPLEARPGAYWTTTGPKRRAASRQYASGVTLFTHLSTTRDRCCPGVPRCRRQLLTHLRTARMSDKIRYRDYRLAPVSTLEFDGTYRSRAALTITKPGRPMSQRFVDFEAFATKAEADEHAITEGKRWIDDQYRIAKAAFFTEFDTLA
jgi:hypothetical protein